MRAEIKKYKGALRIFVDGEIVPPDAYITYFTENACYGDFAAAGYRLFSLPVFLSSKTLNENSQAPCLGRPIFDGDEPDWGALDEDFHKILSVCPDALIFPRINVSPSERWERENPDELCDEGRAPLHRPCFSSDKWAEETKRIYAATIEHIEASDYAERVIGYQFAAGNTEEWFPHDMRGSIGKRSREKFALYCAERGLDGSEESLYEFLSDVVAIRICDLASLTKKLVGRGKLCGTFYGYTLETPGKNTCHHSLDRVLRCPDIDFLCSPVSYAKDRALGRDHSCMLPSDSLKEWGKLYFAENDTRTHLTEVPFPEIPYFQNPVFKPKRFDDTAEMLKLHYARALVHGYAHWWFDMWGGWYADETYMGEMSEFLEISKRAMEMNMGSVSEVAVFVDEKCYKHGKGNMLAYNIRESLGLMGAPYDCYLASDFERVKGRYSAYIVIDPFRTETVDLIIAKSAEMSVPCLVIAPEMGGITPEELRDFCRRSGVHLYTDTPAVVYANESFIFVHARGSELPNVTPRDGKKALVPLFGDKKMKIKHESFVSELFELK